MGASISNAADIEEDLSRNRPTGLTGLDQGEIEALSSCKQQLVSTEKSNLEHESIRLDILQSQARPYLEDAEEHFSPSPACLANARLIRSQIQRAE